MAESGEEDNNDEVAVRQRINREGADGKCRTRFDILATPKRRFVLALYENHAYHLPRDKVENVKQKLQELYAMTPEETEKYFLQLRKEAAKIEQRRKLKLMLKKMLHKQKHESEVRRAYRFVEKLLRHGMMHAYNHPVPPLISVRLRNLSDIILEQICDLRNIDHPDREKPDQVGLFLIAVADWMAIAVEHIYYAVQLKKNAELAEIEEEAKEKRKTEAPIIAMDLNEMDAAGGGEDFDMISPDIE